MRKRVSPDHSDPYGPRRYHVRPWGRGKSKGHAVFDARSPKAAFPGAWTYITKVKSEAEAEKLAKELEGKEEKKQ